MMDKKTAFLISPSAYSGTDSLKNAKEILRSWNFNIKYLPDITSKYYYYAGDYKRRANEINNAYKDKDSKYIFTILGGMGSVQTLPYLDYNLIKKTDKVLIGFSDVTILLNTIFQKTGAKCIHGPNLNKSLKEFDEKTISCLFDVLKKKNYNVSFEEEDVIVSGTVKGSIVGGNLCLLERSLGTDFEVNTTNKIIFIEDVRMKEGWVFDILWQLKLAGKFDNVKGIILGHFVDCGDNIEQYLRDFFKDFKCPVIMNQPIGHKEPNFSIPFGEICIIDTNKKFWKIQFKN